MILFLLLVLGGYAVMHLVVFLGIRPLLAGRRLLPALVGGGMGVMIVAPILVRLVERWGAEFWARWLALIAFNWMGVVFVAANLFLVLAGWRFGVRLLGHCLPSARYWVVSPRAGAWLVIVLALVAGCYGSFEARQLRVETVRLTTDKLPPGRKQLRVAQVSDLHLGLLLREQALAPVVARLRELRPDLLVATGDMVDAEINHLDGLTELWRQCSPPLGKFAVVGNHEVYAGLGQALAFLEGAGFRILRNRGVTVGGALRLIGVDDAATRSRVDEVGLLAAERCELFTILLKHRPLPAPMEPGDLQLSGHTHRGQIFPFSLLTGLLFPRQNGLTRLSGGNYLYASRGTGTWGPPMRILSPPEITLFEIVAVDHSKFP